jgi:hypothetical protein
MNEDELNNRRVSSEVKAFYNLSQTDRPYEQWLEHMLHQKMKELIEQGHQFIIKENALHDRINQLITVHGNLEAGSQDLRHVISELEHKLSKHEPVVPFGTETDDE